MALLEREFALDMLTAKGLQVKSDELRRVYVREVELAQVQSLLVDIVSNTHTFRLRQINASRLGACKAFLLLQRQYIIPVR